MGDTGLWAFLWGVILIHWGGKTRTGGAVSWAGLLDCINGEHRQPSLCASWFWMRVTVCLEPLLPWLPVMSCEGELQAKRSPFSLPLLLSQKREEWLGNAWNVKASSECVHCLTYVSFFFWGNDTESAFFSVFEIWVMILLNIVIVLYNRFLEFLSPNWNHVSSSPSSQPLVTILFSAPMGSTLWNCACKRF